MHRISPAHTRYEAKAPRTPLRIETATPTIKPISAHLPIALARTGVAIIVETMTDNRNRTASEVRHYFDKYGGNMGATGCVSWSFDKKGVIVINDEDQELDEDKVMEDALEAGAADFAPDEGVYTVYTDPDDVASVAEALTNDGYELLSAQVEMVPQNTIKLTDEGDIKNLQKMLDMFEDNEDVQNVWHNWEE